MNKNELEQAVIDGEEVSQILRSKAFKQIDDFLTDWSMNKFVEHCQSPDELQQVAYRIVAHRQYLEWLESVADSGKLAAMELSKR